MAVDTARVRQLTQEIRDRVDSIDAEMDGDASNGDGTGGTAPPAPTNFVASVDQVADEVALTWGEVVGATYRIESRWRQDGVMLEDWHTVDTVTTMSSVRGPLADDSTYDYRIVAIVDGIESAPSAIVTVVLGTDDSGTTPAPDDDGTTDPAPVDSVVPDTATLLWIGDFSTGDFSQWDSVQNATYNGDGATYQEFYGASIVTAPDGEPAARFEVRDGDVPDFGGGERSEVGQYSTGALTQHGDTRWYEWEWMFENFPPPHDYGIVMQWHPGSGSPSFLLSVDYDGNLILGHPWGGGPVIGSIDEGVWHSYALRAYFDDNGWVEVWRDGVQVVAQTSWPTMSSSENYFKTGIYRGGGEDYMQSLQMKGLRIYQP